MSDLAIDGGGQYHNMDTWGHAPANELTRLRRTLIQTPSVNGIQPELAVAERVTEFARRQGLDVEMLAREPQRLDSIAQVAMVYALTGRFLAASGSVDDLIAGTAPFPPPRSTGLNNHTEETQ